MRLAARAGMQRDFFRAFVRCAHLLDATLNDELIFFEVSARQMMALEALDKNGGWQSMSELADWLGCSKAAATQTVARLLEGGYVAVEANNYRDRRQRSVELQPAGRSLLNELGPIMDRLIDRCTARLTEEERADLREKIRAMALSVEDTRFVVRQNKWRRAPKRAPPVPQRTPEGYA